jgi:hypothetical protein
LEKPRLRWRGLLNAPDGEEWQVRRGNDQYRSPGLVSQCLASRTEGICQVACRVACITATRMTMCRCSPAPVLTRVQRDAVVDRGA